MTLWDIITSSAAFMTSLFDIHTDYASVLLSETHFISFSTLYYKIQYTIDYVYAAVSIVFTSVFFSVSTTTFNALTIAFKFLVLIALLIFIRGGIPRYRFDHLTKIGWIKYLSLVLASILIQFLLLWMC